MALCAAAWRRVAVAEPAAPTASGRALVPNPEFAKLASDERLDATAAALERNGIRAVVVDSGQDARPGSASCSSTGQRCSTTLENAGIHRRG